MVMRWRGSAALVMAAVVACGGLAGCGGSSTSGGGSSSSRARIYDSLEAMVGDSDLVVAGTAGEQRVVTDSAGSAMTFTVTDLAVDTVVRSDDATASGSTVVVRQVTTAKGWTSSEPDAALEPGERYLLFLVHSALPGEAAAQFYPVGVVAGIYRAQGEAFTRLVPDSGDDLPLTLTAEQLRR